MKKLPQICACIFLSLVLGSCASGGFRMSGKDLAAEYYTIAEAYVGLAKYDKAIPYYQKASRQKEYANLARYGLARAYALAGQWDDACAEFGKLYKKDPSNTILISAYAYALVSAGRIDEGLELYGILYEKKIEDPQAARDYAEILVLAGKFTEAQAITEELKANFPDSDALKEINKLEEKIEAGLNPPEEKPPDEDSPGEGDAVPAPENSQTPETPVS
ncbi:tetratricopeptide repeat protein [Brucepastera parasyntrophica]|uniref:tetratricopeptide repeat protein n=1 Tax=Brucepastera parasyntrophica TaxID=2880008 RepID=UPI002108ACC7|nr:tetratricopeptide repeat protein [Brucepastera parasyntrophica]ULQ59838.1 tetratricopeptide repeat protein [Brucepastera parasyntrophica]